MFSATYVALSSQGLRTRRLKHIASMHFVEDAGERPLPGMHSCQFWDAFVEARRQFRLKTGMNIEQIIACSKLEDPGI